MFYFWLACVLVCDVGKQIALLLSVIQRTAKGRLPMESVSVSGIEKNLNSFCRQIPRYGPRFLQPNDNKLRNQSLSNNKANRLMKQHCRPPSR